MEHAYKVGDWCEYEGDISLVVNHTRLASGVKLLLLRNEETDWVASENCKPIPDCTGWDWVKPEPKYRPFKDDVEFWGHRNHWITRNDCNGKQTDGYWKITGASSLGVWGECDRISYQDLLAKHLFIIAFDGEELVTEPCGVLL